mmetsp:Transcript_23523/g.48966  ORF Transcript_23523/g.48966 Transcript_23523/m.48966 type:complete len:205 (-) Transcript_23523:34-648(-)
MEGNAVPSKEMWPAQYVVIWSGRIGRPMSMAKSFDLRIGCFVSLLLTMSLLEGSHVIVLSAAAPNSSRYHGKGTSYREAAQEADASLRGLGMWSVHVGIVHLVGGEVAAGEAGRQITLVIHNQATGFIKQLAALSWVGAERVVLTALLLRAKVLAGGDRISLGDVSSLQRPTTTGPDCGKFAYKRPQHWSALLAEIRLLAPLQS